jgi:hypothetical protein
MYVIQKNSFIITTLATLAILTTMTIMVQQEVFGSWLSEKAGDLAESVTGARSTGEAQEKAGDLAESVTGMRSTHEASEKYGNPFGIEDSFVGKGLGDLSEDLGLGRSTQDAQEIAGAQSKKYTGYSSTGEFSEDTKDGKLQKAEKSWFGKKGGDLAEGATGCRSTADPKCGIKESIPFVIPIGAVLIPGTINIEGTANLKGKTSVSIMGFEIKDLSISTKWFKGTVEPSVNQLVTDVTGIDIVKEVEEMANIDLGEDARIIMKFTVDWSKGESYNDISYCYPEFKKDVNNLNDVLNAQQNGADPDDKDKNAYIDVKDTCSKPERYYAGF